MFDRESEAFAAAVVKTTNQEEEKEKDCSGWW